MRMHTLLATTLAAFCFWPAMAHDGTDHGSAIKPGANIVKPDIGRDEKAREYFTDRPVVTQDGNKLRFYSDVLQGRIVVISLFYTNCTGACPLTTQKLAEVQDLLGDAMGRDIFIVSLTVDPKTDTPEVLRSYAEKFGAKNGWLFLTGNEEDVGLITYRLGQTDPNFQAHSPFFMLGNVARAHWARIAPHLPAPSIVAQLRSMANPPPTR